MTEPDDTAFEAHLEAPHFRAFDALVRDWTVAKAVQTWRSLP